jgi:hypothetical protein
MKVPYQVERFRPVKWRRRLLLVALAVATAISLLGYMMGRRSDILRAGPPEAADVATCKGGKTEGCVGGMATVIMAPAPAAPASAP